MNVEDYIASGILEAYLLGELSDEEMAQVESMAAQHSQVKEEIQAIEQAMEQMARRVAIEPPSKLKERLIKDIQFRSGSVNPSPGGTMKYLVAASVAVALVTSVAALIFWNNWQDAESRISDLLTQNLELAENFESTSHQLEQTTHDFAILTGKNYHKVIMEPVQPSESSASVYWNQDEQKVFLNIAFLPPPPAGKQYQLWALVNGQPLDAGIFDLPTDPVSLIEMKSMADADAFAITLEPTGGSLSPTLEDLQVIGNV